MLYVPDTKNNVKSKHFLLLLSAGCEHDGRVVGEGEQFRDDCKICQCSDGLVSCKQKRCPLATCSRPTIRDCCRYCGGKNFSQDFIEYPRSYFPTKTLVLLFYLYISC